MEESSCEKLITKSLKIFYVTQGGHQTFEIVGHQTGLDAINNPKGFAQGICQNGGKV
jgi:hypothetical protein